MVDYGPVLARAIAALNPNTGEQRRVLYDRARKALAERLRADPGASQADLRAESAALEDAIRRIEADELRKAAAPRGARAAPAAAAPQYRDRAPLKDPRRQFAVIAGVFGLVLAVAAGAAVYFYPPPLPSPRDIVKTPEPVPAPTPVAEPVTDPSYIFMRQLVYYRTNYPVGTIVVDKSQAFLYVVRPRLAAMRYRFGLGSECANLVGLYHVAKKEEWPGWKKSDPAADRMQNPLGARALYLDKADYRIHGTGITPTVKQDIERCIGLINDDVIDLYERTDVGNRVVVLAD